MIGAAVLFAAALLLFSRLGGEFIPTLDEKNVPLTASRVPSISLSQAQSMISATLLTLFVLPALCAWFGRDRAKAEAMDEPIRRAAE